MASWLPSGFVSGERIRDVIRSTFWLIPALCVVASIGLAAGLIALDRVVRDPSGVLFLFPGPPEGALSFLSSIVAAMISFTGLVFSITFVVLQLSSGQFSPRVLRHFLRDRTVRWSLGIFIATFVYAMVVQRAVLGTADHDPFVPRIAMAMSFVFVLGSVGLFIAYLSRVSNMIRLATIVAEIGAQGRETLKRRFECRSPMAGSEPSASSSAMTLPMREMIFSPRPGVIVSINEEALVRVAAEKSCLLTLNARVGDFVPFGGPLCAVREPHRGVPPALDDHDADADLEGLRTAVQTHISLDNERTSEQDLAFSLRELVDIAERALSPAVNDPTTACQCIDEVHDIFRRLAVRAPAASEWEDEAGVLRLMIPQYEFSDYLNFVVGEIWLYGARSAQVPARLATMLADLATVAMPSYHADLHRWLQTVTHETSR